MVGEEQQIASELADLLVQCLFEVGLELNAALKLTSDARAKDLIDSALDRINDSINTIRRSAWSNPAGEDRTPPV